MKKRDLKKLALMGLSSGILVANQAIAKEEPKTPPTTDNKAVPKNRNDENSTYHLMTEDELLLELDDEGIRMYNSLTPEGKALAREVASVKCNQSNPCKGLNACKTDTHECAGKGSCKNTNKCAPSDPNLAVKLVYDKMADKRAKANQANTTESKK